VLELPSDHAIVSSSSSPAGLTSEFDAMVVSVIPNGDLLTVQEVWDAKATLDVPSMYDVLKKKVSSLQAILCDDTTGERNYDGLRRFVIYDGGNGGDDDDNPPDDTATTKVYTLVTTSSQKDQQQQEQHLLPKIGMFCGRLSSPKDAARQFQQTICERHLEKDLPFVQSILTTTGRDGNNMDGSSAAAAATTTTTIVVPPFIDEQVEYLEQLIQLVDTIQPTVVISSTTCTDIKNEEPAI
jgi:hypothetical protein